MEEIPPSARNAASSVWLVLTRSGVSGEELTIRAPGAPWMEVSRLAPLGLSANFASKRPAVTTVRCGACELDGVEAGAPAIIIFAAPDVRAWSRRRPPATKKSIVGAVMSKSCGGEEFGVFACEEL